MWNQQRSLSVTSISLPFFAQFNSSVAVGTYGSTSATYTSFTSAIKTFADGFIAVVAKYTPSNGGLAEQYSRSNGTPVSAVDLTWSYAAALTAFQARAGVVPGSWGAKGLTTPGSNCGSSTGNTGGGGSTGTTVAVTFNVQATTVFGGMFQSLLHRSRNLTLYFLFKKISTSLEVSTPFKTGLPTTP